MLAVQINIAVLISSLGLGKVLPPKSFPLLKSSWDPVLPSASLEQGLPLPGVHKPAHVLCAHPDSRCSVPAGSPLSRCNPPPHLPLDVVNGVPRLGSDFILEQLQKESALSCLIRSLFPCPSTHAGWPLLPSVTLPCSAGAGVGVWPVVHYLHCLSFLLEHRLLFLD